jgi:hypothetical protein
MYRQVGGPVYSCYLNESPSIPRERPGPATGCLLSANLEKDLARY